MHTLGRHALAELYGCNSRLLDDEAAVRRALLEACDVVAAEVMGELTRHYAPQGVSCVVMIAESHMSIHTWPEHAYAALDLYTCGDLDPTPGIAHIAEALEAASWRYGEILRGLPQDLASPRAVDAPGATSIFAVASRRGFECKPEASGAGGGRRAR